MCRVFITFTFHGHEDSIQKMINASKRPCAAYCRTYEQIAAMVLQFFVRLMQYKTDEIITDGPSEHQKIPFDTFPFAKEGYNPMHILLGSGDCDNAACLFLSVAKTLGINPFSEPTGKDKYGFEYEPENYPHMDAIRKH